MTQFNQVRFLSRLRKMDLDSGEEYLGFLAEMRRFNEMGEELFRKRVMNDAYFHSKV